MDMGMDRELLTRFKGEVKAIRDRFWTLIQMPHIRPDGTAADKRTLLVRYAERRGLPQARAEDVADEALVKALNNLYQYEPRPGKRFMNWLYVIARRTMIDLFPLKPEEGEGEGEGERGEPPDVGAKPIDEEVAKELVAVEAISCLIELCAREPEGLGLGLGLVKALITSFHQIIGYKPKEIIEELGGFSLKELFTEFQRACLRMGAFDRNEELVSELLQPFHEELKRPDGPGRLIGELRLREFWQAQSRADYYIQNISRRTWERVREGVLANLSGVERSLAKG